MESKDEIEIGKNDNEKAEIVAKSLKRTSAGMHSLLPYPQLLLTPPPPGLREAPLSHCGVFSHVCAVMQRLGEALWEGAEVISLDAVVEAGIGTVSKVGSVKAGAAGEDSSLPTTPACDSKSPSPVKASAPVHCEPTTGHSVARLQTDNRPPCGPSRRPVAALPSL